MMITAVKEVFVILYIKVMFSFLRYVTIKIIVHIVRGVASATCMLCGGILKS